MSLTRYCDWCGYPQRMEWIWTRRRWHCRRCGAWTDLPVPVEAREDVGDDDPEAPHLVIIMHPPKVYSTTLKVAKSEKEDEHLIAGSARGVDAVVDTRQGGER